MHADPAVARTPIAWNTSLSGLPIVDATVPAIVPALVRRWCGIDPLIDQCALNQHYVSIHLGGAKRLWRSGEGVQQTRDTVSGAHSVVPAGSAFRWNTEGPVDFAHIYFAPAVLDGVVAQAFDRDPARVALNEALGVDDPLVASLASALLDALHEGDAQQAYLDDLLHLLAVRVLRSHSRLDTAQCRTAPQLAPFRLRRACDFVEANLSRPIGVAEIATAAGISAYHFSRAFRQATGRPPYAFLLDRRLDRAKRLLTEGDASLTHVARECGFASLSQFSRSFRRAFGTTPTRFRNMD